MTERYNNFNIGDYFMPITIVPAPAPTPAGYRRRVCFVAQAKTFDPPIVNQFVEIIDPNNIANYTDNQEIYELFNGGLRSCYLAVCDDLANLNTILQGHENDFFTLIIGGEYTDENKSQMTLPAIYNGVVGSNFLDLDFATAFSGAYKQYASADLDTKGLTKLFALMLSNQTGWYNNYAKDINLVGNLLSTPENYLDKKVSFIISNAETGTNKIGGFFTGGKPATTPYIMDELKLNLQDRWIRYRTQRGVIARSQLNCKLIENDLMEVLELYCTARNSFNSI
ncbi:MAG: hypothetical protein Ta2D_05490 [Rickettsiales bacterium]|nr:MAG: hypothetical protein Ta2D_05490 [Rickettsiales bacterium]